MREPAGPVGRGVTPREVDVLRALDEHLSNAEIAARLYVSERTVESHVSSLLRKLQVANRRELARLGRELLGEDDGDAPTNLPIRSTSFLGRSEELDALDGAIREHPFVTLVGPAGVGKTRLALEAGSRARSRYPGGTWFVDLAAVARPEHVPRALADVLSVVDQPGEDLSATIVAALAHRPATLVILDNCENVMEAVGGVVASVLASGGRTSILATSRHVLGLLEQYAFAVPPLAEDACIELFVDRARRIAPNVVLSGADLDAVALVCRHLDHLPLAIELAATQIRLLEPAELAERLDDRFRLLSAPGRPSSRHRSMAEAIAWSYERLTEPATQVFRRLSVFAGSCTIDAAEAVCAGDGVDGEEILGLIGELVDRSMLIRERDAGQVARYRMLETLRAYGLQQLETGGGVERLRRAHATYYLSLTEGAQRHLFGPEESIWMARLRAEEPNLRLALDWLRDNDAAIAVRLSVALWPYWHHASRHAEAVAYLRSLFEPHAEVDGPDRAWALAAAALLSAYNREADLTKTWAEQAIAVFGESGEERGPAYARLAAGWAVAASGPLDRAEDLLGEVVAAAERLGDKVLVGLALECRGHVASWRGDYEGARRLHELELATWTELGSRRQQAWACSHLAHVARSVGELDGARELATRALEGLSDSSTAAAHVRTTVADIARLQGRDEEAAIIYEEALAGFVPAGDRRCIASTYKNLGQLAQGRGAYDEARALFFDSMKLRHELGDRSGVAECLDGVASVDLATGRTEDGVSLLAAARALRDASGGEPLPENQRDTDALLAAARADLSVEKFERAWAAGAALDADAVMHRAPAPWRAPDAARS